MNNNHFDACVSRFIIGRKGFIINIHDVRRAIVVLRKYSKKLQIIIKYSISSDHSKKKLFLEKLIIIKKQFIFI